jgi:hypothetical protein
MKANKKTLMAVKQFLLNEEGWELDQLKEEIVEETKLLKNKEMGDHTLATDECGIEWDGKEVCVLSEFVDSYTKILLEKVCNVIESFAGEDISEYDFD